MNNIITLDSRRQAADEKAAAKKRKRKIQAVQKVLQCTRCAIKCEKCGAGIETVDEQANNRKRHIPYRFCESCSEEYADYINRLKGDEDSEHYWHNSEWMDIWKKWIEWQHAIDRYLKTKEFNQLLNELKQHEPE
jgi:hypothetical protein